MMSGFYRPEPLTYDEQQRRLKESALIKAANYILKHPSLKLHGKRLKQYKKKYKTLELYRPRREALQHPVNARVQPEPNQASKAETCNPPGTPKQATYQRPAFPRRVVDGQRAALGETTHQPVGHSPDSK